MLESGKRYGEQEIIQDFRMSEMRGEDYNCKQ